MTNFTPHFLGGAKMDFTLWWKRLLENVILLPWYIKPSSYASQEYVFTPSRDQSNTRDGFTVPRPLNRRSGGENAFYSPVAQCTIKLKNFQWKNCLGQDLNPGFPLYLIRAPLTAWPPRLNTEPSYNCNFFSLNVLISDLQLIYCCWYDHLKI